MPLKSQFKQGKYLSECSTFGIGGKARFFIEINTIEEMQTLRKELFKEPLRYWVLGKGSNVLFDDRGFDGLVILNKIDFMKQSGSTFEVGAGYSFSLLGNKTARLGFAGLEFASGIPGSVGGAVYMNAGASGGETCEHLSAVSYVDEKGRLTQTAANKDLFDYRSSPFQQMDVILVAAIFKLIKAPKARAKQLTMLSYRLKTQPYGEKSGGCVFRNPQEISAGALIERAGLKGKCVGDAQVSLEHANFIINKGKATARDILTLADDIKIAVKKKMGYELEFELRYVPYR